MTVWLVWFCLVLLLLSVLFSSCLRRMIYMIMMLYMFKILLRLNKMSQWSKVANSDSTDEESRSALMAANAYLGPQLLKTWESSDTVEVPRQLPVKNSVFWVCEPLKVRWVSNLRQYSGLLWRVSLGSMGLGTCSMECIPFWTCFLEQRHRREVLLGKIQLFFPEPAERS